MKKGKLNRLQKEWQRLMLWLRTEANTASCPIMYQLQARKN